MIKLLKRQPTSTTSSLGENEYKGIPSEELSPHVTIQPNQSLLNYKSTSYKAIHYERQTQLRVKHRFNLSPFYEHLPLWCSQAKGNPRSFMLRFDFTLPGRRKIKRKSVAFDLVSAKEYEAAHQGLMYARSMVDIFADELYKYKGYTFSRGLQIGPSWVDNGKVKTCAVLTMTAPSQDTADLTTSDVLTFVTRIIFSHEELNHMQAVTAKIYCNGELLGFMEIEPENNSYEHLEIAHKYYSGETIQKILYANVENRNVLYAFKTEKGIRPGMMVKTEDIWNPVEIIHVDDIYRSVQDFDVVEFIPAVNRKDQDYPSMITIETDPGDMLTHVLGRRKTWVFNTYVTEKIVNILDQYNIQYNVKFSGNKGWHIIVPVELQEPLQVYQKVVEAIVNKELGSLPDEKKVPAMMANLMQLEDVKSYKDPFFVARRFVDLIGARIMFYELTDIHTVLTLNDLRRLCLRVSPVRREDLLRRGSDIYDTEHGPVKVEIPQVLSINPYSKFRRQFKLLIDHSSNKKEGKLRSVLSLHSGSGLVSIPAVLYKDNGLTKIDRRMWDYDFICDLANPERVYDLIEGEKTDDKYLLRDLVKTWEVNYDVNGFEQFLNDHKGLLIYLLQNGGEALELLDTHTARWVNASLWKRTINLF